jgi:hypothetical protein
MVLFLVCAVEPDLDWTVRLLYFATGEKGQITKAGSRELLLGNDTQQYQKSERDQVVSARHEPWTSSYLSLRGVFSSSELFLIYPGLVGLSALISVSALAIGSQSCACNKRFAAHF